MASLSNQTWVCEKCTFINPSTEIACTICFSSRMVVKDLQTTWEWQADEKWIPYDYPTTLQIEDAYQNRESHVLLKSGFFASHRGYEIIFEWRKDQLYEVPQQNHKGFSPNQFIPKNKSKTKKTKEKIDRSNWICERIVQRNTETGNERNVRRLGTDDSSLFIVIDRNILTEEDKCCVCQMTFMEEDDDEEIEEKIQSLEKIKDTNDNTKKQDTGDHNITKEKHTSDTPITISTTPPPILTSAGITTNTTFKNSIVSCTISTRSPATFDTSPPPVSYTTPVVNKNKRNLTRDEKHDKNTKIKLTKVAQEEEEEEEDIVVKLPNCTNHYFHRECIAKWVKLKGFCPYCKRTI